MTYPDEFLGGLIPVTVGMCVCVCVCVCVCAHAHACASVWGREEGKQNMGEINLILRRTAVTNMGKVRWAWGVNHGT